MELLTIQHEDFELSIECAKFETVWEKARNNVGEEALMSTYSWSDGVQSVMMSGGAGEDYLIEKMFQLNPSFLKIRIILYGWTLKIM